MKIPLSWISLYSPLSPLLQKYAIKDLAHEYSIHTAEIDGIEEHFIDKVVVGKVLSCEKHPDSTKLSICEVDVGTEKTIILTGAPNIVDATYVPVAVVGTQLAPDFTIGERKMAGMMSRGMICGADEIGLASESDGGIMILENTWDTAILETMIGKSLFDLTLEFPGKNGAIYSYALRDTTFEIDNKFITNRPDLFSVTGNSREFHAVFETDFIPYSPRYTELPGKALKTKIETSRVLSYNLMKMEGIEVKKSPFSISLMMERAGLGAKMDIVDITNLIMTELGQPMHAFDADKIVGNISVRLAKKGEKILALNGVEYTLTEEDMVIADERGPVAIAGVIGGMESAVSEASRNIIWESACFDPTSVRLTAQRHGVRTDASTRYEKSLDPLLAVTTFSRVEEYLSFLGKSYTITGSSTYIDTTRVNHITIDVSYDFIDKKAGVKIPEETVKNILTRLGFDVFVIPAKAGIQDSETGDSPSSGEGRGIRVTVPSWRATKDISIKEDIAEEVARVYGYENVPYTPLDASFSIGKKNSDIELRNLANAHFQKNGWNEVYNYSFTSEVLDKKIGYHDMGDAIAIQNAFNEEYTHMIRSLAPRLLLDVSHNQKYSDTFAFFEIGKVYRKSGKRNGHEETLLKVIEKKPYPERKVLAGVTLGYATEKVRGDIESFFREAIGYIPPVHQSSSLPFLHPGVSGVYSEGEHILAKFGRIHPETAHAFDISSETLYFEIDYEKILELRADKDDRFHEISRYQTIPRELNFVLEEHTPTGDIAQIINAVHPWIQDVSVDSIYRDEEKVGMGKKSVNYAFLLSNNDGTISDDEAMNVQNLVIETMRSHGYSLRA